MSKDGIWTGIGSGVLSGASAGSKLGPYGAVAGGVIGGILGGVSGNADDKAREEEAARLKEEEDKRMALQKLGIGMSADQVNRNQGLSGLNYLSEQRINATANARRRALRDSLLYGGV